jgi:oxygen-independent coproporphyrinogen-3 oxidase
MNDLWQPIQFDREMIRKYDRPGPRYTSYPTAPQFSADFGPAQHADLLAASVPAGRPLSLYVHIPFCAHRCFFCGCNVTISHDRSWGKRYLPLLEKEMELAADRLDAAHREVIQIHWGGGTPTFLPPEDLTALMATIRRHFRVSPDCEIGVEVDPRECSTEHLDALAAAGFNRLSMGLQELDPKVQLAVNRLQSAGETWAVIDGARRRGIQSLNVDLIYGLPYQTPEGFAETVREVLAMAPDRLALFNFAYLPQMFPHQKTIRPETLPDAETKLRMLEEAIAAFTGAGYIFIGMDHFARPEDTLAQALRDRTLTRNFQGYSTCAETDLVAFGVSSISEVAGGYAQNVKTLGEYRDALEAGHLPVCRGLLRTREDELRRDVILALMCHFRIDKAAIEARHAIDFDNYFADELERLEPMAADGLVEIEAGRIEVAPRGRLLVRNIAMTFDGYLSAANAGTARYSRTV